MLKTLDKLLPWRKNRTVMIGLNNKFENLISKQSAAFNKTLSGSLSSYSASHNDLAVKLQALENRIAFLETFFEEEITAKDEALKAERRKALEEVQM